MTNNQSDKRGIALVIVLGMLALLVMVGVAFSVFMRTERHAAGSFQHDVRGRLLLNAAASRALEALDANLTGRIYPDWTVLYSKDGPLTNSLSTNQVWAAHIPESLLTNPDTLDAFGRVCWIPVVNGKIGYLIFNASGLLDVNTAGGGADLARGFGVNPREIRLSALSEIGSENNANTLVNKRAYESVDDLKRAGSGIGLSGVNNLVTFSRIETNTVPVPIDMALATELALKGNQDNIKDYIRIALNEMNVESGTTVMNADMAIEALIDYVDADSVPENLNGPCTERVPMINEVRCVPTAIGTPVGFLLGFDFQIELFYPFLNPNNPNPTTYTIAVKYAITALSPAGIPVPGAQPEKILTLANFSDQPFSTINVLPPMTPVPGAFAGQTAKFSITIEYINLINADSEIVDTVKNLNFLAGPFGTEIALPAAFPCPKVTGTKVSGAECVDPRYNFMLSDWKPYLFVGNDTKDMVAAANGTMGRMNAYTTFQLNKTKTDGFPWMHVANEPFKTAGEWSYIVRGGPDLAATWRTFRLLPEGGESADPIYKYFTVKPALPTQRGFVNPNTDSEDVLTALFKDMPLDSYPGEAGAPAVDAGQARNLARKWMSDPTWQTGYSSPADLVGNSNYIAEVAAVVSALSYKEFRREAALRNLFGLVNPRQNYFIIALFSQSSSKVQLPVNAQGVRAEIETTRSDQSGILELWRDPVPRVNAAGVTNHPMIIRRFDVLNLD